MNDLSKVLEYENENILFRFMKIYNVSEKEASKLFMDTKKWLYAVAVNTQLYKEGELDFLLSINDDLLILDEMWHNFILFTKDYNSFCIENFGFFIHHQPMTKRQGEIEVAKENIDFVSVQNERRTFLNKQYSFTYDLLGQETLIKWHKEFPVKYSPINIKNLRK